MCYLSVRGVWFGCGSSLYFFSPSLVPCCRWNGFDSDEYQRVIEEHNQIEMVSAVSYDAYETNPRFESCVCVFPRYPHNIRSLLFFDSMTVPLSKNLPLFFSIVRSHRHEQLSGRRERVSLSVSIYTTLFSSILILPAILILFAYLRLGAVQAKRRLKAERLQEESKCAVEKVNKKKQRAENGEDVESSSSDEEHKVTAAWGE